MNWPLFIAPDKRGIYKIFFLFLHKNIYCGYSLEAPQTGTSNEYPQHMFSWRNKKISVFFCWKNCRIWSYTNCSNYNKIHICTITIWIVNKFLLVEDQIWKYFLIKLKYVSSGWNMKMTNRWVLPCGKVGSSNACWLWLPRLPDSP